MTRALSRTAALAALTSLLVVPALHGALGHLHAGCDEAAAATCMLAAVDARVGAAPGARTCPLCLASGAARTLLATGSAHGVPVDEAAARAPRAPEAPPPITPLARAVSAPRAPPVRS